MKLIVLLAAGFIVAGCASAAERARVENACLDETLPFMPATYFNTVEAADQWFAANFTPAQFDALKTSFQQCLERRERTRVAEGARGAATAMAIYGIMQSSQPTYTPPARPVYAPTTSPCTLWRNVSGLDYSNAAPCY